MLRNALILGLVCLLGCTTSAGGSTTSGGTGGQVGAGAGGPGGSDTGGSGAGTSAGIALLGNQDCDPMVPTRCGLPFPSDVYLADDPSTVTGKRVHFGATTLPVMKLPDERIPRETFSKNDGWSAGLAPITHLPGATITGLPTQDTIATSLEAESPTILIEADTGAPVAHFAELDMTGDDDADRAFMLRPVVRLKDATRYIVAVRNVVDSQGAPLEPTDVFKALRDGTEHSDPSVAARRDLYSDIIGKLDVAGYETSDLQIAWDFTTSSLEHNTRWLLHMRDEALALVGDEGPEYKVTETEDNPNEFLRRRIRGTFTVPLYLDKPGPGGKLVFGDDGMPEQNGTAEYEFVVHVPHSATTGTPGALLQNGHGLLGSLNEGQNGYLADFANDKNYVAFSVYMIGMASEDEGSITNAIFYDFTLLTDVFERQHQGMLNQLLAMRMMKGRFYKDEAVQFEGKSAIDPNECYYRGDSQGGIFGGTYMALTTDVRHGLLGEPGMAYNFLLNRSVDFDPFLTLLKGSFDNYVQLQIVLGLAQLAWDRTDPIGYFHHVTDNPLPGTPSHNVLIHAAIGDYQVTPLGAHMMARAIGAKNVPPVNREIWGIPTQEPPFSGNGIVEFSFGLPESPKTNTPPTGPKEDDPHDSVRVLQAAFDQTDTFLRHGIVARYCDGACDPE